MPRTNIASQMLQIVPPKQMLTSCNGIVEARMKLRTCCAGCDSTLENMHMQHMANIVKDSPSKRGGNLNVAGLEICLIHGAVQLGAVEFSPVAL